MAAKLEEQEISINATRTDDTAIIYCSDSTWVTKMDKLVKKSPALFKVVREDEFGKTYSFPKRLISIRSGIVKREYTEEQRKAMGERFRKSLKNSGPVTDVI